jgi:site-specific DNA recombinase
MKKIDAFYGRNSSDEQAERGTIQAQVDFGRKYFDLHEIKDYEMFLDEGVSGTKALEDRSDSARMLELVKAGKIRAVYVYRLDRLARSVKHVLNTYDLLEEYGVRLVSMTESFDTGTPTGKFFMTLLASIAALERETILERTQMGKDRNAKQGHWVAGAPPFGYRITDHKLEIYEPEAETVRLIFKLYREGMSTVEIPKLLNANNKPTPATSKGTKNKSSGKWHAGHISIILRSEVYAGKYIYLKRSRKNKETIEVESPIIIEPSVFQETQKLIIENSDKARGNKGRFYLLRGLIYCGHCGRALVGSSGDSKSGRVYYRCSGTIDQGQGKRCDSKLIRATDVENAIWEDIKELFNHPEQFEQYIDMALEENKKSESLDGELAEVENNIQSKHDARSRILSLVSRNIISDHEAESELKNLADDISALEERREFLFGKQNENKLTETEILNTKIIFDILQKHQDTLTDEEKAQIINGIVKRIEVFTVTDENGKRGNRVEVAYRVGGMGLGNSGDSQMNTTLYSIESTWIFQAFSRKGGFRLRWK